MKKTFTKIILLALAVVMLISAVSCQKDEFSAPTGMVTASTDEADFYFYVPKNWTVDNTTAAVSAYYTKEDPSSVSFMAWSLDDPSMTIDSWWDFNRSEIEIVFKNFTLETEENAVIDELYAKKYTYTASLGEFEYKIMQAACIKNGDVYVFTYTSIVDNFDTHLDDVNHMIDCIILK